MSYNFSSRIPKKAEAGDKVRLVNKSYHSMTKAQLAHLDHTLTVKSFHRYAGRDHSALCVQPVYKLECECGEMMILRSHHFEVVNYLTLKIGSG